MTEINSNNDISFSGNVSLANQIVRNFHGSGVCKLINLICKKIFTFSGRAEIKSSKFNEMEVSGSTSLIESIAGNILSSGRFQATNCPRLQKITGSGFVGLDRCSEVGEVVTTGGFALKTSKVSGNVTIQGREASIEDSAIEGTLKCAQKIVKISNSSIQKIVVKPNREDSVSRWEFRIFSFYISFGPPFKRQEQVIELSGEKCQIGSIAFEEGAVGKVLVKAGASVPIVTGLDAI